MDGMLAKMILPRLASADGPTAYRAVTLGLALAAGTAFAQSNDAFQRRFAVTEQTPSRATIFSRLSSDEQSILAFRDKNFATMDKNPNSTFYIPSDTDDFSRIVDSPDLGQMWKQNVAPQLAVKNSAGYVPQGAKSEAAIFYVSPSSSPNMRVAVDIDFTTQDSKGNFGVLFRAGRPADQVAAKGSPLERDDFYFAIVVGPEIVLGTNKVNSGTDIKTQPNITEIKRVPAPLDLQGRLEAVIYTPPGDENAPAEIRIYWNGQLVLTHLDAENRDLAKYTFGGVVSFNTEGAPITFDNFECERYGGPFEMRMWPCATVFYEGPNVFHWPILLEQPALERYGHSYGNLVQAPIAHAVFFFDVIGLPYSMARGHLCQLVDDHEFHRPGDVVLPFQVAVPEYSTKGLAAEAAVLGLGFTLLP